MWENFLATELTFIKAIHILLLCIISILSEFWKEGQDHPHTYNNSINK